MSFRNFLTGGVCFSLALYIYIRRLRNGSSRHFPLPPGPKKLPFIGNLLNMPKSLPWVAYHNWSKELGSDIIHLSVAGTSIVVLDSVEATTELLEKKSSIYSGRPRMPMLTELMGWDYNVAFMPYGENWRQRRKVMDQTLHPNAITAFHPHELKATHELLRRLLDDPADLMGHFRHMSGEIIMSIAYGINVLPKNDPYIAAAEEGIKAIAVAAVPGAFLVDVIPALKYVPEWMPLAGFKRKAREWRKIATIMADMPFERAKHDIALGNATPSFVSQCLERMSENQDTAYREPIIRDAAGTLFLGGADTTVSAIASCFLGLLSNPQILKKAQQEIDTVLGIGQLPSFDDADILPHTTAIIKETLRWRVVAPLSIPHLVTADDTYKGYRIPAGSIIIPNTWAMLHDESVYPDPFEFKPERFIKDGKLDHDIRDPGHAAFGFGRRLCPGRHMAYESIWIAVASVIAAFDITKAKDENGNVIEPTYEYIEELMCMPLPFKCSIKPRSKKIEDLIRSFSTTEY